MFVFFRRGEATNNNNFVLIRSFQWDQGHLCKNKRRTETLDFTLDQEATTPTESPLTFLMEQLQEDISAGLAGTVVVESWFRSLRDRNKLILVGTFWWLLGGGHSVGWAPLAKSRSTLVTLNAVSTVPHEVWKTFTKQHVHQVSSIIRVTNALVKHVIFQTLCDSCRGHVESCSPLLCHQCVYVFNIHD